MSDLVERLRAWHTPDETITGDVQLYLDAAARIEALEAALQRIVGRYEWCMENQSNHVLPLAIHDAILDARAALAPEMEP